MKSSKNDAAAVVIVQITAVLFALLISFLFPWKFPTNITVYLLLFLASMFYAILDRLQGTVRKNLEVSVTVITNQISQVFLISYGVLFLGEKLGASKFIGISTIIVAIAVLTFRKGGFKFNKYILLNFMSRLAFSIAISIDVGISKQFNFPFYIAMTLLIPAIIISVAEKVELKSIKAELNAINKKHILTTGVAWVGLIFFMIKSFQLGEFSVVSPISSLSVFLNSIVAYFFLKERENITRKVAAAILVTVGIILVT